MFVGNKHYGIVVSVMLVVLSIAFEMCSCFVGVISVMSHRLHYCKCCKSL